MSYLIVLDFIYDGPQVYHVTGYDQTIERCLNKCDGVNTEQCSEDERVAVKQLCVYLASMLAIHSENMNVVNIKQPCLLSDESIRFSIILIGSDPFEVMKATDG